MDTLTADKVKHLSIEQIRAQLDGIVKDIEHREQEALRQAGINANSLYSGLSSGGLSFSTPQEDTAIYLLKQELMTRTPQLQQAAHDRILARRAARKAQRQSLNRESDPFEP